MDIANYVGLFLLKNEYCFLPGIGSLMVQKRPAVYNKETKEMLAPAYDIVYRQEGGSIDDSFANFIANNERISIAHAANHLKDFCAAAKADLKEGKSVIIPGIGSLQLNNGGIQFVKDPSLHIEGRAIPYFRNSDAVTAKKEEALSNIIERTNIREPKANEQIEYKAPSVNWGKIGAMAGILVILIAAGVYLFMTLNKNKAEEAPVSDTVPQEAVPPAVIVPDTTAPAADTSVSVAPATNADGTIQYKVALNSYPTRQGAEGRANKLKSYGHPEVEVFAKDSGSYFVVIPVTSLVSDTTKVVDSLRRLYNPKGTLPIIR
jgi:nucleoid DNA-binding protein